MIQLKDTKNWEITQDHPRTGRPRTARTSKKIKAARERIRKKPTKNNKGDGRKLRNISIFYAFHSQKRPYKYLRNSVSGTDRNEIEMKKQSVYLSTRWCTIAHLKKNSIMVQIKLPLILGQRNVASFLS